MHEIVCEVRIQLWSYNYDPEPMGIGPVSRAWATSLSSLGHRVEVVAAHPHYPRPEWGSRLVPYREVREGVPVTRLPLSIGRETGAERMKQELSFLAAQTLASPFLGTPDVLVSVSPSFPALLPAMIAARARRIPWVLWLQDILPDGAAATGYVERSGFVYRASRRLERAAYAAAARIAVLSESFRTNLVGKGVPSGKIDLVYNPATLPVRMRYREVPDGGEPRIVCIGNIGRSQGLEDMVRAFEESPEIGRTRARFVITGSGVAEQDVRSAIKGERVRMTGLLDAEGLERELGTASLALVSQAYDAGEFNVPSKLMNYLASGLPVIGSVRSASEAARIIRESGAGEVTEPAGFGRAAALMLEDPERLSRLSANGFGFAEENLRPDSVARRFEEIIERVTGGAR